MNSINSHCGMVRECRIDSFVHSTTNYEHKNTSDMKRNFMQSKIVKQLSIVNLQLSVANCTLLIVFCFLFGGKAWGQTTNQLLSEGFGSTTISSGTFLPTVGTLTMLVTEITGLLNRLVVMMIIPVYVIDGILVMLQTAIWFPLHLL